MKNVFIISALAESTGEAGYNRAVARQLQRETGASSRAARNAIARNANGRAPFTPAPGRNATNVNVRRNTAKLAGR